MGGTGTRGRSSFFVATHGTRVAVPFGGVAAEAVESAQERLELAGELAGEGVPVQGVRQARLAAAGQQSVHGQVAAEGQRCRRRRAGGGLGPAAQGAAAGRRPELYRHQIVVSAAHTQSGAEHEPPEKRFPRWRPMPRRQSHSSLG